MNNEKDLNSIEEKRKDLILKCRNDFATHLRKLHIKEKCEKCGTTENLEVHHKTSFIEMLNETIKEVGIDNEELIRKIMLGKQLTIKYATLCKNCHTILHAQQEGGFYWSGDKNKKKTNCTETT